jgi:hypothetical protein
MKKDCCTSNLSTKEILYFFIVLLTGSSSQVLADIAEDNKLTVDKVRTIAKDNGISLSR